jgi:taurine--2-oxoglutarate transaminase
MTKTQVMLDGPKTIAAIFMEPIVGTNGIIIPPQNFMTGLRQLCDENGILLVIDETMAGWGRSGKWFGIDHYGIVPDILTTAKGITSGYVQLGLMVLNRKIWDYFQEKTFTGGLTYSGHALACAAGIANIEVYKKDSLIEHSARMGAYLDNKLQGLKEKHPSVGDVRCKGLWACIELTSDRKTRTPLAGFGDSMRSVSAGLSKILYENGLYLFAKWDYIFISPPLIINQAQIDEMIEAIDKGLDHTDSLVK